MLDRVIETFDHDLIGDVTRDADREDVAEAAIENNFGGVRISACEHRGERKLSLGNFGATLGRLIGMLELAGNQPLVAIE